MSAGISLADREALRSRTVAKIPAWYSPWLHLLVPAVVGVGVVVLSVVLITDLRWWELLVVPATFLISNASEWRIHKGILHKRVPGLTLLYDRHTPLHHMIFQTEDMAVKSPVEWRLVLIPAFGIVLVMLVNIPLAAGMMALGLWNVGLLYLATAVGYVLSYEWLHLAYHLPRESAIGRLRIVGVLRRHHATHHHPPLMQKWNFNVTFPLWDWVRGTIYRGSTVPGAEVDPVPAQAAAEVPREARRSGRGAGYR